MNYLSEATNKRYLTIILAVSVLIPIVVALLLFVPQTGKLGSFDVSSFPHINALLNTLTALALIFGYFAVKSGNRELHKKLMLAAFVFSAVFLVLYVLFHFQGDPTYYGDLNNDNVVSPDEKAEAGILRSIYLFILLTHIVLAIFVVPLALTAIFFGLTRQYERHKKIVRWTFPIWTYVAVTGVLIYLMISPYYS